MSGQADAAEGAVERPAVLDAHVLDAAAAVLAAHGSEGLTLVRVAEAVGTSRMTLHRRGVTVPELVAGLSLRAAVELKDALFPALTGTGPARLRLVQALEATFDVADRHLPVLAGLFAADGGVFHAEPDATGALPTADVFVAPFVKLLVDGAADGTLSAGDDPVETAAVLFNAAGWAYVQLRHSQHWPAARARDGVLALVMNGLTPAGVREG